MENEINGIINDIDKLLEYSQYYLYKDEKEYKNHRKNLKDLKKKLKNGKEDECIKKGCDII